MSIEAIRWDDGALWLLDQRRLPGRTEWLEIRHWRGAAAAIRETLNGCGVLVREKNHAAVAELIGTIVTDKSLREGIVKKQLLRLDAFSPEAVGERLRSHLSR